MLKAARHRPLVVGLLGLFLTACPSTPSPGGAPQIMTFTATPAAVTSAGQEVELSWTIAGAVTALTIDNGVGPVGGKNETVRPTATTTYRLTAANSSGNDTATTTVTVGSAPPGDRTLSFGVSASQTGPFESDASGNITGPTDPRVLNVAAGSTFYAQVSYSGPNPVTGVTLYIANQNPPGLQADLEPGRAVGGFTVGDALPGCTVDGTQASVSCVYPITVAAGTPNITSLQGAGGEFAYVFRTKIADTAGGPPYQQPPRGYVTVGNGGTPNPTPGNRDPVAAFTSSQIEDAASGATFRFSALGSSDPDGDPLTYSWSFGDGTGASTRDFTKRYAQDGVYTVTLTVDDGQGGTDDETKTFTVPGGETPTVPVITSFTASDNIIGEGDAVTLSWVIAGAVTKVTIIPEPGDGPIDVTARPDSQLTVSPDETTTYTISAENGAGAAEPKKLTVTVADDGDDDNEDPEANFTVATGANLFAQFTSTSEDDDGSLTGYDWNFGDGTAGTGAAPGHLYGTAGTYRVTLTVTDDEGATNAVTKAVVVPQSD